MNDIQVGRYSAILHKLLDMKEGSPAPVLAPEVFPMLVLENERPEWEFLAGGRLCSYTVDLGAPGPTNYAAGGIVNPAGSGVLAVVTGALGHRATAGNIYFRLCQQGDIPSGTYQDGQMRDSRLYTVGAACQGFYEIFSALPGVIIGVESYPTAGAGILRRIDVVLTPGYGFYLAPNTDNLAMLVGVEWRERALSPSELR